MKKRQIFIVLGAVLIFVLARLISNYLATPAEKKSPPSRNNVTTVFTQTVRTASVPVLLQSTGLLEAVERMDLLSEVQGVMLPDGGRFNAGNSFDKGEVLLALRADDKLAQLVSQRSGFEKLMTGLMPDIQLDFPDQYGTLQSYLRSIDVNQSLPELPVVQSEKLKRFLTGRNLYTEFYAVRNTEILYSKYVIRAPYKGILAEANVDPGTVVRPGQELGVFIRPGRFELRASADQSTIRWLEKGQEVELYREADPKEKFIGTVSRVNHSIDPQSQMSEFFVAVDSDQLKDGMFLQLKAKTRDVDDAYVLSRSVLFDHDKLFVVEDGFLKEKAIEVVHFYKDSVIVQGLKDGSQVLSILPPGAFAGMEVSVYQENKVQ